EPENVKMEWVHSKLKQFEEFVRHYNPDGMLYLGFDIARKKDLSEITLTERIQKIKITRMIIILEKMKFWVQERLLWILLNHRKMHRGCIDETGIGAMLAERAQDKFGELKVEGVTFTPKSKSEMAFITKRNFEDRT